MWAYVLLVVLLLLLWYTTRAEHQSSCNTTASSISECEDSIKWLRDAIDEDTKKYTTYIAAQQKYNNDISNWNYRHGLELQKLENGRRTTSGQIWHNGRKYNCSNDTWVAKPGQMVYR